MFSFQYGKWLANILLKRVIIKAFEAAACKEQNSYAPYMHAYTFPLSVNCLKYQTVSHHFLDYNIEEFIG